MPTTPTYPGVYIEEIPSGVRTITGVATSIAAFIDYFDRGPMNRAFQLFNMGDFQREFGGLDSQSEASYAIQQFFLNGGTEAWVVRVASADETTIPEQPPAEARVEIDDTIPATAAALTVTAISAGEWGNRLRVRADNTAEDGRFNLIISDFAAVDGRNMLVGQEIHRNLSMDEGDKNFVKTVVNDPDTGSKLVRVEADGTDAPLANGTLSGPHQDDPTIPDPPKVKVTIGHDPAGGNAVTVPLRFSQDVDLSSRVPLTTIAPALQSALRRRLPAEPAFAGATVEVVGNPITGPQRLRILAGSDDPDNRVTFANIDASPLAQNLKLDTAANLTSTLSGAHDQGGPEIPAASTVNVTVGGGDPTTVALDFSDLAGVTLPDNVSLVNIASQLQDAIHQAGPGDPAFEDVEVHVVVGESDNNRLLILSNSDTDPVEFDNTTANIETADALLLTGTDVSTRMTTLSGEHDQGDPEIPANPEVVVTIDGTTATQPLNFTDLADVTLPDNVSLEEIAPRLQNAIADAGGPFSEVEVHAVGDRLVVLSTSETDSVDFASTDTADALKLVLSAGDPDSATNLVATRSGEHTADPQIPAAPPVEVTIDDTTATAPLVFEELPAEIELEEIRQALQAAIREASTETAFNDAIVAIVRDNRLLVLPGENATVEFDNTPGTTTANALKLVATTAADSATNLMATLSGEHTADPQIPPDPEVDMTIDGGDNFVTIAPDFSALAPGITLPANVPLTDIAPPLQRAISRARSKNPTFSGATVDVVVEESDNNRLLVLPGGTDPDTQIEFAPTSANTTADDLLLTATATDDTATHNLQEYTLGGDTTSNAARLGGVEGKNGVAPDAAALLGEEATKTGIYALEDVDLFNLLCIPRVVDLPEQEANTVISRAQTYCEKRRAFLLIDTPRGIDEPQEVKNWVAANISRHRNAAFFYPRVRIADPLDDFRLRSVGASGTLAGLFARIDSTRGVWKAPAGTAATLVNVSQLDDVLTDQENGALNPLAINCLRNFPIYGNVSWGARTLDGSDQQASEWKYIPVRRLALFLEESLYRGIKWVVFEPNDEPLWAQIRLNVGAFMHNLFRQGAFQGQTPRDAYFVKCDAETTTQNDINLGIVNILVGFAPLKPAEFVILKIQQMAGQIET